MGFFKKSETILQVEQFLENVKLTYSKYDEVMIKKKLHTLANVDFFLEKFIAIKTKASQIIVEMTIRNDKTLKKSIKQLQSAIKELDGSIDALEKAKALMLIEQKAEQPDRRNEVVKELNKEEEKPKSEFIKNETN